MLTPLILTPLLGALALLVWPSVSELPGEARRRQETHIKQVALAVSLVAFVFSVLLWVAFDPSQAGYQAVQDYAHVSYLHLHVGIDGLSLYLVLLTTFLTPICLVASWDSVSFDIKGFMLAQLLTEAMLLLVFTVLDLVLFYVFFEAVLVPLFLVVGVWGASTARVRASMLLFLYTLAGSLFMLVAIVTVYSHTGTTDLTVLDLSGMTLDTQRWLWLAFALAFAVKTPLVPFHMWLPRAHAEAPLAGSMVLAGTVLKLSTYGFLRVLIPLLPDATLYYTPLVQAVAIVTLVYSSLATIRQSDLKALVAYSSISHMAVVVLGVFSNSLIGIEGAILLSLAHGVVSPAMFMIVGGVLYDRYHTRVVRYYRGLTVYMPVMATLFFITTCCNMGVPLSLNWLGELMSLTGAFQQSAVVGILGASSILLSACYSIWLWARLCGGSWSPMLQPARDVTRREVMVLVPLLLMALVLGLAPNVVLSDLHTTVSALLYTSA